MRITTEEAEKAGLCAECISYKPDQRIFNGSACWSMRKTRIESNLCTRKGMVLPKKKEEAKASPFDFTKP
jgi:hypothetical protein